MEYKNQLRINLENKHSGDKDKIIDDLIDMYLEEARLRKSLREEIHKSVETESYSLDRFKRAINKYLDITSKKGENDGGN